MINYQSYEISVLVNLVVDISQLCTSDTTPYVNILRFDGDTFAVYGKIINLSEHTYQVILGNLLENKKGSRLKTVVFVWK